MADLPVEPAKQGVPPLAVVGVIAFAVALGAGWLIVSHPQESGLGGAIVLGGIAFLGLCYLVFSGMDRRGPAHADSRRQDGLLRLAEGTATAMALTTSDGAVIYANPAYRRQFGIAQPATALARTERDAAALYRLIRTALANGASEDELRVVAEGEALRTARVAIEAISGRGRASLVWRIHAHGPQLIEGETATDGGRAGGDRLAPADSVQAIGAARIVAGAPVGIALIDAEGRIVESNPAFRALTRREDDTACAFATLLNPADVAEFEAYRAARAENGGPVELRLAGPPERMVQVYVRAGEGASTLLYVLDATEQKNLELQFAQSQKMQAVGQLAGGIAHDFNNTLQAMIGFCELLLMRHPPGDPSFADIDQIRQNATRAAALVRQLLAFSRQQTLLPRVLWLPDAIADLKPLLLRLVGDRIELDIRHDRNVGLVKVDETQLGQVLMNLAANARDAMPDGGTLTIRTANIGRAESAALGHELMPPADYVLLEVTDTGTGIPPELLGKIFEPFFTTKDVGQGTGLGLSSVYGIVKQTNGFIFPESALGKGTSFRIYLPRHAKEESSASHAEPAREALLRSQDHTGRGTVLIVEDEDAVRAFAVRALASRGYTVLEASNGEIALDVIRGHEGKIDLLISDVIMPAMDGPTLVKTVKQERPDMRIVLISGYAEDAFREELGRDTALAFLPKPFSLKQLVSKVKEVMAG